MGIRAQHPPWAIHGRPPYARNEIQMRKRPNFTQPGGASPRWVIKRHDDRLAARQKHLTYPTDGIAAAPNASLPGATNRLMHRSKKRSYSITSSTIDSTPGGMVSFSAFAVFKLRTH